MTIYDRIADEYDRHRREIGARDLLSLVEAMGKGLNVLDLGCGTGHPIAVGLVPRVSRYLGIDNSEAMLAVFRRNLPQAECASLDMTEIERLGGGWDFIFSWGALCHLPAEAQACTLTAAAGLLNPGGRLLFTSGEAPGQCKGSVGPYRDVITPTPDPMTVLRPSGYIGQESTSATRGQSDSARRLSSPAYRCSTETPRQSTPARHAPCQLLPAAGRRAPGSALPATTAITASA